MAIYFAAPRAVDCGDDTWDNPQKTITVYAPEDAAPVDTGLVDIHGVTLWRMPTKHPVGFQVRR